MSVRPKSERHKATFEWGRTSFLQEARMLARFSHPSIVRVTRVFEANSTAYMVMSFERGMSFDAWLKDLGQSPTQEELDRFAAPLLDALEAMHAVDFLHRDIAPDNIIVRPDGSPVLLDFGTARRAVGEMSRALTGIVKAGYSPQEQYATDSRRRVPGPTSTRSAAHSIARSRAGRLTSRRWASHFGRSPETKLRSTDARRNGRLGTSFPRIANGSQCCSRLHRARDTGSDGTAISKAGLEAERFQGRVILRFEWRKMLASLDSRP